MIRNVVVHMVGEQPLLADIETLPTPQDACLVCTNLRTSAGTRPTFIDARENWFLIPLSQIRFVEIPEAAMDRARGGLGEEPEKPEEPEVLELDEEFLRRIKEA